MQWSVEKLNAENDICYDCKSIYSESLDLSFTAKTGVMSTDRVWKSPKIWKIHGTSLALFELLEAMSSEMD